MTLTQAATHAATKPGNRQPRPDLAGQRVKSPTSDRVYLIGPDGYRRWIPDMSTYNNLFASTDGIITGLDTDLIAEAAPLDSGAFLAVAPGGGKVYLVSNLEKRWVVSPDVMTKYSFDWTKIQTVPAPAVNAIPTGVDWS